MAMMNCYQAREELDLSFGSEKLSDEITRHLNECEACRAYHEQLMRLVAGLGEDQDVDLSPAEIERAVRAVELRITPVLTAPAVTLGWLRPVTRFAAAAMIVLVAYGAYEFGKTRPDGAVSESGLMYDTGYGTVTAFLQNDDVTEMDDNMVSVLIDEYSASARIGADEALLGDITAEELEYLKKNLEVGELL
jgi:predicted anti-sigma-YlaC factor YlaD